MLQSNQAAFDLITYSEAELKSGWISTKKDNEKKGIALAPVVQSAGDQLFSFFNFFIFGFILAYYNIGILIIFLAGNTLYVLWVLLFMRYRRVLDMRRFAQASGEQSNLIQLITGMQEIKLNNCEYRKRWQWGHIQVKLFKINETPNKNSEFHLFWLVLLAFFRSSL